MTAFIGRSVASHAVRQPLVLAGLAALGGATLTLAAVVLTIWLPAVTAADTATTIHALRVAELKDLRRRQEMTELYRTRTAEAEASEKKLQLARSEPQFVAEIEKAAVATRAELLQFSSRSAPKDKTTTETTVFEFSLKGDYAAIKAFLAGLRDLPEFVTIERVVLERMEPGIRARILLKRRQAKGA